MQLTADYEATDPRRELFVKFSRDFDDVQRDNGRTQMDQEIAFAALSRAANLPVAVPTVMFGDYHRDSGTGVLITERIRFGSNGIERQYDKCMDYAMPDQLGHYRAVLGAVARVAGTHAAGRMPREQHT
jgi:hypothetical protein